MIRALRIGIPLIGGKGWLGGISYIELLVRAVAGLPKEERPQLFLVLTEHAIGSLHLHSSILPLLDGFVLFMENISESDLKKIEGTFTHAGSCEELFTLIDFYYPVQSDVLLGFPAASWIPDFQHIHLPQFFSEHERSVRDSAFGRIARHARMVVLSSRDAEGDFRSTFPQSRVLTRVLNFYSLPDSAWYSSDTADAQRKYALPDFFLICCNQFWMHKGHENLFRALALLKSQGAAVHLACTGATEDYRAKGFFSKLLHLVDELGIGDLVHILGNIPREEQIQLIRRSVAVVQPSLFEGWSTVVEDCRVLGKTIILSDLAVHLEQAPEHAVYFRRNDLGDLAQAIHDLLPELVPGPDEQREARARDAAFGLVERFARQFCSIAEECVLLYSKTGDVSGGEHWQDLNLRGEELFMRGDKEGALALFCSAVERCPSSPAAYNNLGVIFREAGDFESAVWYFQKAVTLDPFDRPSALNFAAVLVDCRAYENARKVVAGYLCRVPGDDEARELLESMSGSGK
jgi:glycosyltransferase involved in cell wall biosynthesis